eukprot:TRINITY_DN3339_c0_g1_i9.p1 TRINITY_DN3339_c0_g1~~TRINITY_DN3339_c0_g1_i9.p1  ORF type:complete len:134 (+),score=25.80 TRINITY_DN3339_c0_g1_i9:66-467(+)
MCIRDRAKMVGYWKRLKVNDVAKVQDIEEWNLENGPYKKNKVVLFNEQFFVAVCKKNAGIPGDFYSTLLYLLFYNPSRTRLILIFIMNILLIFQNLLLVYYFAGLVQILLIIKSSLIMGYMLVVNHHQEKKAT